jgi:hypothetical protein
LFGLAARGTDSDKAGPFWKSLIELSSGECTNAMRRKAKPRRNASDRGSSATIATGAAFGASLGRVPLRRR